MGLTDTRGLTRRAQSNVQAAEVTVDEKGRVTGMVAGQQVQGRQVGFLEREGFGFFRLVGRFNCQLEKDWIELMHGVPNRRPLYPRERTFQQLTIFVRFVPVSEVERTHIGAAAALPNCAVISSAHAGLRIFMMLVGSPLGTGNFRIC